MLGATFFMKGSVCEVPVRLEFQVQGAAKSIVLTCEEPVSLTDAWRELGKALEKTAGFGLPDIPDGPWTQILDAKLILSAWLTAGDAGGRGMSAYVGMDFCSPLHIGGTKTWGDISITLEPDIAILGVYIAYDPQEGGVDVRCKVLTPTTPSGSPDGLADGSPTPPFSKMVSFPPPLPAQNSVSAFKLKYLGIGQRVGPEVVVHGDDPMAEIFEILETQLTGNDPREVLTRLARTFYHPDRDWFIAAHLLMRGWDLKVLFNDPTMYGLEISAPKSSPPDFFSGFLFEILYQKLGPNLGVYFGRIDLPTNLRRIPLNGFILILPNFSAWIYTNGDFRINVGWPLGDNSIGIQMDVLMGARGLLFRPPAHGGRSGGAAERQLQSHPRLRHRPVRLGKRECGCRRALGLPVRLGQRDASGASRLEGHAVRRLGLHRQHPRPLLVRGHGGPEHPASGQREFRGHQGVDLGVADGQCGCGVRDRLFDVDRRFRQR